jgi:hypothetical protein
MLRRDPNSAFSFCRQLRAKTEAVVRCLDLPHDIGGVAVDLLPEHVEGRPRLSELLEQLHKESPNRLGTAQHAIRCEEPRLGGGFSVGAI